MSLTSQSRLFLGLTLLGASLALPAGEAKAAPVVWCGTLPCKTDPSNPVDTATVGDKVFTAILGPTLGSGTVDVDVTPTPDHPSGIYQVDIDFDPLLINSSTLPVDGTFKYQVDIVNSPLTFSTASLLWAGQNSSVTKKIYSDDTFKTLIQTLSINGEEKFIPGALKAIWVEDTYTVQPNGYLDNVVNTYTQVPGPLPLVGAGAAFTFSRRLRRRTKKAYKLG